MPYPAKKTTLLLWVGLLSAGAVTYGFWRFEAERSARSERLQIVARSGAAGLPREALASLTGTPGDETRAAYESTKAHLQALCRAYPDLRFAYIFRFQPEQHRVIFLADSEPEESPDLSRPGDVYPEAPQSPGLQHTLATGESAFEGPWRDEFGVWVTAYAAVGGTGSGDVLGLDIAAFDWGLTLVRAALEGAAGVWVLGGLPLVWWWWRHRRAQLADEYEVILHALEQSESAIMIVGLDRRIAYANSGLCRQLGYSAVELKGRDWRDFKTGETSEEMLTDMVRKVRAGLTWEGNWTNRRRDGSSYPVRGHITPVRRENGKLRGFVAIFDDMTLILQREQELRAARDRAQAGERAKGQFLATMSHEVRTPLNGIVGYLQLLNETPLSAEQRNYLGTIRTSAESLVQLASQILDYSRMEEGRLSVASHACDPQEILEESLELFAARAAEKSLWLLHRVGPDVPRQVMTDSGRLRQILLNLIGNAVKFTAEGDVSVTLTAETEGAEVTLRFVVTDSGPGIAAEDLGKLFKPFVQLEAGAKRRHGGAGLGLGICRELSRALGGDVEVTSGKEGGASFTATIRAAVLEGPRRQSLAGRRIAMVVTPAALRRSLRDLIVSWEAAPVVTTLAALPEAAADLSLIWLGPAEAAAMQTATLPEMRWTRDRAFGLVAVDLPGEARRLLAPRFRALLNLPLRHKELFDLFDFTLNQAVAEAVPADGGLLRFGLRVLIVEDNLVNRVLIQRLVERAGCKWVGAANGEEALEVLRTDGNFDAVLMDLHMPVMDGIDAVKGIRAGEAGEAVRDIWVAAVTADIEPAQRRRMEEAGANDFVAKPVGRREVDALLFRFLEARRNVVPGAEGNVNAET